MVNKERDKYFEEMIKKDPKFREITRDIIKTFLPQQIVGLGLYKEYLQNPQKVMKKILKYIDENENFINSDDWIIIVKDYYKEIEAGKTLLSKRYGKEEKEMFYEMAFISFFSWIEGIIHNHLSEELEIKGILVKEANKFLEKIRFDDKFGILLKILVGKDMSNEKIYGRIKHFKKRRDFLIHYKPTLDSILKKHPPIKKRDLEEIIDVAEALLNLLKKYRSKENSKMHKEMEDILKDMEKVDLGKGSQKSK